MQLHQLRPSTVLQPTPPIEDIRMQSHSMPLSIAHQPTSPMETNEIAVNVQSQQSLQFFEPHQSLQLAESLTNQNLLYELADGTLVSAEDLITGEQKEADSKNTTPEQDDVLPDESEDAIIDADDTVITVLQKIAMKAVKIEANQKNFDRRMQKVETGLRLILDVLSIDGMDKAKGIAPMNELPGALVSRFKPIDTTDELNTFENNLKNTVFYNETVRNTFVRMNILLIQFFQ